MPSTSLEYGYKYLTTETFNRYIGFNVGDIDNHIYKIQVEIFCKLSGDTEYQIISRQIFDAYTNGEVIFDYDNLSVSVSEVPEYPLSDLSIEDIKSIFVKVYVE